MLKTLRLTAALLASLALPALAQTPAPTPSPARPATPAMPARPATPATSPVATPPAATPPAATPPATPRAAATAAAPATAAGSRVDINAATEQQLDTLPGIGPVRAKAIVAGRPYADLQDLVTKNILTQGVLDGAKGRMALANINTSTAAELEKTLPGIGAVRSKAIVAGRPYATPQDLVTKKVLTQGVFDKIKELIAF